MKRALLTIFCSYLLLFSFGQTSTIKAMVDRLKFLRAGELDCSADLYWRIIAQKDKAIPFLIDNLNDITPTNISFRCKAAKLNVAELSYFALNEITPIPVYDITRIKFDVYPNNCWSFYDYFFANPNKPEYQKAVRDWYSKNKSRLKKKRIAKLNRTDCQRKYNIKSCLR